MQAAKTLVFPVSPVIFGFKLRPTERIMLMSVASVTEKRLEANGGL